MRRLLFFILLPLLLPAPPRPRAEPAPGRVRLHVMSDNSHVGSGMDKKLGLVKLAGADGKPVALHGVIFRNLFASWLAPVNASLAFALCFVLVWLGVMWVLYRRGVFIKV